MNVWRFPIEAVAVLVTTAALLVVAALVGIARSTVSNNVAKGIFSALLVVAALCSPGLVDYLIRRLNTDPRLFIDQGYLVNWAPAILIAVLLLLARVAFPSSASRALTRRWRWTFIVIAFFVLAINFINWCSPGWCATYGLPLPYFSWSDVFIDGRQPSPFHPILLALDLLVYGAITYRFAKRYRTHAS